MKQIEKALLYWHTIRNLRLIQIKHQITDRIRRNQPPQEHYMMQNVEKIQIAIPELDENEKYVERFDMAALMQNKISLLHEMHRVDALWNVSEASHLWNYNLHYLEFLIPLAAKYHATGNEAYRKKYFEMLTFWLKMAKTNKDACAAYTISMRIPNVLIGMELLGDMKEPLRKKIYESLYDQYRALQRNLELALLANHYFENLKAIVIASVLFGELDVYHKYFDLLLKQIEEQILPDGLHYERSLMYHKIILEDILRVYMALQSSGHGMDAKKLLPTIKNMAEAAGSLERGLLHTPLFNDAGDNISKPAAALLKACQRICKDIHTDKTEFRDAGYYRLDNGNCTVLFDCGDIGPEYMAGHAHNDCLSFELSIDGKRIFSNSGTGQYQGGLRQFFRSTKAHNTIMIDDREQSELWGEHRWARRLSDIKATVKEHGIIGQFKSYPGDRFRRQIQWQKNNLTILDTLKCKDSDRHTVRQFFHLTPDYHFEQDEGKIRVIGSDSEIAGIVLPVGAETVIHTEGPITTYAQDFGKYEKKQVLEVRIPFERSARLNICIEIMGQKDD